MEEFESQAGKTNTESLLEMEELRQEDDNRVWLRRATMTNGMKEREKKEDSMGCNNSRLEPWSLSRNKSSSKASTNTHTSQIGFLTEWQLYAQKIEGNSWVGEKLDKGKVEKMSGAYPSPFPFPSLSH